MIKSAGRVVQKKKVAVAGLSHKTHRETNSKGWVTIRPNRLVKTYYKVKRVEKVWSETCLDEELECGAPDVLPEGYTRAEVGYIATVIQPTVPDIQGWEQVWKVQDVGLEERKRALALAKSSLSFSRRSRAMCPQTWSQWVRQDIAARRSKYNMRLPTPRQFQMWRKTRLAAEHKARVKARKQRLLDRFAQYKLDEDDFARIRAKECAASRYNEVEKEVAKPCVATSKRLVKKKWNRVCEDLTQLVEFHTRIPKKERDPILLWSIRRRIAALAIWRCKRIAKERELFALLSDYERDEILDLESTKHFRPQGDEDEQEDCITAQMRAHLKESIETAQRLHTQAPDDWTATALTKYSRLAENPSLNSSEIHVLNHQVAKRMLEIITKHQEQASTSAAGEGAAASSMRAATEVVSNVNEAAKNISATHKKAGGILDSAKDMWGKLQGKLGKFGDQITFDRVLLILSQIGHMIVSPNIATVAMGLATMIICIISASFEYITELATSIASWMGGLFSKKQTKDSASPNSDDSGIEVCGTIVAILAGVMGWTMSDKGNSIATVRKLFWDASILGRGMLGIVTVLKFLVTFVQKTYNWIKNKMYYGGDPSHKLVDAPNKVIVWSKAAERVLNPKFRTKYEMYPDYCDHVERFYLEGTAYISLIKGNTIPQSCRVYMVDLVKRLRALREDLVKAGKYPFTRVVPFSIHLGSTQTGIGKSNLVPRAVNKLLASAGIKPSGNAFYKMEQLNDHWDTCQGEPAIVIDDAWNVVEASSEVKQIGAYYNLVSPAPFTPPMACIEDKRMRINPVLLWVNSNVLYPKPNSMNKHEALWRRRDVLINCRVREEHRARYNAGKMDLSGFTEQQKMDYVWLEFEILDDPTSENSTKSCVGSTYTQILVEVAKRFNAHLAQQRKRIAIEMSARISDFQNVQDRDVSNMMDEIYKSIKEKVDKDKNAQTEPMLTNHIWDIDNNLDIFTPHSEGDDIMRAEIDYVMQHINKQTVDEANLEALLAQHLQDNKMVLDGKPVFKKPYEKVIDKSFVKQAFLGTFADSDIDKCAYLVKQIQGFRRVFTCMHRICGCVQFVHVGSTPYVFYNCNTTRCPMEFYRYDCGPACKINTIACPDFALQADHLDLLVTTIRANFLSRSLKLAKRRVKSRMSTIVRVIGKVLKWAAVIVVPFSVAVIGSIMLSELAQGHSFKQSLKAVANTFHRESFEAGLNAQAALYEHSNKTAGPGRVAIKNLLVPQVAHQSQEDSIEKLLDVPKTYIEDCIRLITRNTYTLVAQYEYLGMPYVARARGVFVRLNQMLVVRHCWDEVVDRVKNRGGVIGLVQAPNMNKILQLSDIKADYYSNSNFVLLTIQGIPMHRDILGFFATMKSHPYTTLRGTMIEVGANIKRTDVKIAFKTRAITVEATPNSVSVPMYSSYEYNYGGNGVCGSLLICPDVNPCIIGMHVAGQDDVVGFSEPVMQEMFREVTYGRNIKNIVLPTIDEIKESNPIEGNFLVLGVVDAQYGHHESGQSNIIPSLCHGRFPVATEPAPLSPFDPRLPEGCSPMYMGVAKHGKPIVGFPKDLMEFGFESLKALMRVQIQPIIPLKALSIQEAICGRPGIQGFSPINFSTSEGFPLMAYREGGAVGKKYLFDLELTDEGYIVNGIDDKLKTILAIKQNLRENGIIPFTVFTDCLKDARIAKEKCSIPGKTRVFSTSPVDFSIQCRQYLLPYTIAHQGSRNEFSTAVGINVHGPEWTHLVRNMVGFSDHQLCGDYSNFGAGFDCNVHRKVGEAIMDWFDFHGCPEEDQRVREILLTELVYPWHLCFNTIYQTYSGMPSGSPITVETNDLVNLYYILMAWHEIMSSEKMQSLNQFRKFVKVKTYGDDIWMAVHDRVIKYFNNVSISQFFAKYGVVYTDADKTGDMVPSKSWREVSFLKRTPIEHPTRSGCYLAQLDLRSSLDIANWCWKSKDIKSATVVNLESCSDSLYGTGPKTHSYYREILEKEAHKLERLGNFRNWQTLDNIFMSPQGDTDEGIAGVHNPKVITKAETTIVQHREVDTATVPVSIGTSWNDMTCALKIDTNGPQERMLPFAQFKWSVSDPVNTILLNDDKQNGVALPSYALKKNITNPVAMKFKQNRFVNLDMVVTVIVNTNKFMNGQLYISFCYGYDLDKSGKYRLNRGNYSQMLHTRIQAGSGNPAVLRIPYMYYYPYMSTTKRDRDRDTLNMGRLFISVFNQLSASSSSYKQAGCQVFISFENARFCGLVDTTLGYAQMDIAAGLAIGAAERYLSQYVADANRDMPPVPMVPNPVAIIGNGNLSYGTSVTEPAHVMRLDPRGQTPYVGLNRASMNVTDIARVFGYCTTFKWSNEASGTMLFCCAAGPFWQEGMSTMHVGSQDYLVLPPVTFLASLANFWRGGTELEFTFVGNNHYSGSVVVVFVPGVKTAPSWEVAKACSYTTFELQEERSFTFTVPYVADRFWWHRPYGLDKRMEYQIPGVVCMYVMNEMGLMDSIPGSIDVNVSLRAGCDFEISIPVQPAISSVLFQQYFAQMGGDVLPRDGYFPYYVGTSRYCYGGRVAVLRWGSLFDRLTQFDCKKSSVQSFTYYKYKGVAPFLRQKDASGNWVVSGDRAEYGVLIKDPDNPWYWMSICRNEADAKAFVKGKTAGSEALLVAYPNDDKDDWFSTNASWQACALPKDSISKKSSLAQIDNTMEGLRAQLAELKKVSGQNETDAAGGSLDVKGCIPSTSFGKITYGESFASLTDILRRFQFYDSFSADVTTIDGCKSILVRLSGMIPFTDTTSKRKLYAREGFHSLISTGYPYTRGGCRVKIVCTTDSKVPVIATVQHRPDNFDGYTDGSTEQDRIIGQGYATHVQNILQNPIISLEVPYYLDSLYGIVSHIDVDLTDDVQRLSHLGRLYVFFKSTLACKVNCDVYFAFADDAKFELFQGFLPVIFYDQKYD